MANNPARAAHYQAIANRYRALPGDYGLRPHMVEIIHMAYSAPHFGNGALTETLIPIYEARNTSPKVRQLSAEEMAVGNFSSGTLEIGPITASFALQLRDVNGEALEFNEGMLIRITGPMFPRGHKFSVIRITADRALHYKLTVAPTEQQ